MKEDFFNVLNDPLLSTVLTLAHENVKFRVLLKDCKELIEDYIPRIESKDEMIRLNYGRNVLRRIEEALRDNG